MLGITGGPCSQMPASPASPWSCDLLPLVSYEARVSGQSTPSSVGGHPVLRVHRHWQMHLPSAPRATQAVGAPGRLGKGHGR